MVFAGEGFFMSDNLLQFREAKSQKVVAHKY